MKKFKIIALLSFVFLVLGGFVSAKGFHAGNNLLAYAAEQIDETTEIKGSKTYLLIDDLAHQFDADVVEAGETTGYGQFKLNEEKVVLTTKAKPGFALTGWNVTYYPKSLGGTAATFFYYNELQEEQTQSVINGERFNNQDVTLKFNYTDTDQDGFFDLGTFTISNIFGSMIVDPVFDYIYYNVDVSDVFNLTIARNLTSYIVDEATTIFASSFDGELYKDSYIKTSEGIFYFGDVAFKDGKLCTVKTTGDVEQNVAIERGAFRFGDVVALDLNIDKKELGEDNSVNIDVWGVNLTEDGATRVVEDAVVTKEINALDNAKYNRTESVSVQISIAATNDHVSKLSFDYDNLYLASFEINLDDGENLSSQANYVENSKLEILQNILVENEFAKISNNQFWIKKSKNNINGAAFKIFCNKKIHSDGDVNSVYYTFDSMQFVDGSVVDTSVQLIDDNLLHYADVIADFAVTISYSSAVYTIDFQPYVFANNSLTLIQSEDFVINQTITGLVRGEVETFGEDGIKPIANIGYSFMGYSLSTANFTSSQPSLTVTIDYNKPQNYTVILVYSYYDYALQLANYDSIILQNSDATYFPLASLSVKVNDKVFAMLSYAELHPDENLNKNYNFVGKLKIGDTVSFSATATNGFNINGFYIGEKATLQYEFTIDKTFIQTYVETNTFAIGVDESYTMFTLTYFIDKADTIDGKVAMANLSVSDVGSKLEEDLENQFKITISNLKLFDSVTLSAKANGEFNFVRFTSSKSNFKAELDYQQDSGSPATYSYTLTISEDEQIKVVYTTQTFNMKLLINETLALDSAQLENYVEILQRGVTLPIEDNIAQIINEEFTIRFKENTQPNFGFRFEGYHYHDGLTSSDVSALSLPFPYSVTISPNSTTDITITLMFNAISYQISIYQYGNVYDNGQYSTLVGQPLFPDGRTINLNFNNNNVLTFNLMEGCYIKNFYFVKNGVRTNIPKFAQDNNTIETVFNYVFDGEEAQDFCQKYGEPVGADARVSLRIDVEYELHYYSLQVSYNLATSKGEYFDSLIVYPLLQLSYNYKGKDEISQTESSQQKIRFNLIPYGVFAKVSLVTGLSRGYVSITSWEKSNLTSDIAFYDANSISISKIIANENLIYSIDYSSYRIEVRTEGGFAQGEPSVEVNGVLNSTRIGNFDSLNIYMNAHKINGYKFTRMFYFVDYVYDELTWEQDKENLFVLDGSNLIKAFGDYSQEQNYIKRVEYAESETYSIEQFNANDFALIGNSFLFVVEYNYIKVKIVNVTVDNPSMHAGDLNLMPEDYASYATFKEVAGQLVALNENDLVDYRDVIYIQIKMKHTNIQGQEVDLFKGLVLANINILDTVVNLGQGNYEIRFSVGEVMEFITDVQDEDYDGLLSIEYNYGVEQINVSVTTNVSSPAFYYNDGQDIFTIFSSFTNRFPGDPVNTHLATTLNFDMQFLGSRNITYQFNKNNNAGRETSENFVIKNAIFYRYINEINLVQISPNEYQNYGITLTNSDYFRIDLRMIEDLRIVLLVEPIIHFNNYNEAVSNPDENYYLFDNFTYSCDASGNGVPQQLTVGVFNNGPVENIESSNLVSIIASYYSVEMVNDREVEIPTNPIDVGRYRVKIAFDTSKEEFNWLKDIEINYSIYLAIQPHKVNLLCDPQALQELQNNPITLTYNPYNKVDTYRFDLLKQYLIISDGVNQFKLVPDSLQPNNIRFDFNNGISSEIVNADGERTFHASDKPLNILISNIYLMDNNFSKNFVLESNQLLIPSIIRILKAELTIRGLSIFDKVEDGTTDAEYRLANNWGLVGKGDDDVAVILDNIKFKFDSAEVGEHSIEMTIDDSALIGASKDDYFITTKTFSASIYPFSIETYVEGLGKIIVYNPRGLTDHNMVNLIPIGAELNADVIYSDSAEYRNLYSTISQYISNRVIFAVGFKLYLTVGEFNVKLNQYLYVSLPGVERLNSAVWLSAGRSGKLGTSISNGRIVIDLSEVSDVDTLIFTQNRKFLSWWQIALIILFILIIIILLIIIYVRQRQKQKVRTEINEKI